MRASLRVILSTTMLGWWLAGSSVRAAESNELTRATSISRQFVVHAPGSLLPHALCVFAEQVRRAWRDRLELSQPWRDPIVIVVKDRDSHQANSRSPSVAVYKTDLHLKYQITWLMPPPLDQAGLVTVIVEALCAEAANRNQTVLRDAPYVSAPLPPWVIHGFSRAVRGRDERLLRIARRSLQSGRPPTAESLITSASLPDDDVPAEIFETHAWLLLEELMDLHDGAARLRQFLAECGNLKSATEAFWKVYRSEFSDAIALEKWWALQLGDRTRLVIAQNLSLTATQRTMQEILRTPVSLLDSNQSAVGEQELAVADLWQHYDEPWLDGVISDKLARLESLRDQAAQNYSPVIDAYREAFNWLKSTHLNRFRRAIDAAEQARRRCDKKATAIDDYVDRMEMVHSPMLLDEQFNLFKVFQQLDQMERRRHSAVGDYLNQFEK